MDGRETPALHVDVRGSGPRTLWVHGAMSNAARTWRLQTDLVDRWTMLLVTRRGTPPGPSSGDDFDADAYDIGELLRAAPAHVVAHSYGCMGAIIAAGRDPHRILSLSLLEPPAFHLVNSPAARSYMAEFEELQRLSSPADFRAAFMRMLGHPAPDPRPLDAETETLIRLTMRSIAPWKAELPLTDLVAGKVRTLVVTGAHDALYEDAANEIALRLGAHAHRAVVEGAGHLVPQMAQELNLLLEEFWLEVD
ncbi:alpha/beta hydrolase [Mycolicibacterium sp. 120266]|uniref:alpha/beta fold hydrolase n=1 Tax=Mycolicibacterium sp. 120266 TaxID=3090601 RepID=UPI00299D86CD|nr:alpha/beta hydrolase [Mycolicibacterium sp. 120266]MDX1876146.1 alpha/beta hydrolase [Mycolicibacterium sp. 120266]